MRVTADLKSLLFSQCVAYADQRIETARTAMAAAQDSSNQESKSTAGDKHDTSRAMMQIDAERAAKQLSEAEKLRDELARIDVTTSYVKVQAGAGVKTTQGNYFIAVSAGKLQAGGETFFAVSIVSPIAQSLKGLSVGAVLEFNGKSLSILEVF